MFYLTKTPYCSKSRVAYLDYKKLNENIKLIKEFLFIVAVYKSCNQNHSLFI